MRVSQLEQSTKLRQCHPPSNFPRTSIDEDEKSKLKSASSASLLPPSISTKASQCIWVHDKSRGRYIHGICYEVLQRIESNVTRQLKHVTITKSNPEEMTAEFVGARNPFNKLLKFIMMHSVSINDCNGYNAPVTDWNRAFIYRTKISKKNNEATRVFYPLITCFFGGENSNKCPLTGHQILDNKSMYATLKFCMNCYQLTLYCGKAGCMNLTVSPELYCYEDNHNNNSVFKRPGHIKEYRCDSNLGDSLFCLVNNYFTNYNTAKNDNFIQSLNHIIIESARGKHKKKSLPLMVVHVYLYYAHNC